jgi:hypothetical protein
VANRKQQKRKRTRARDHTRRPLDERAPAPERTEARAARKDERGSRSTARGRRTPQPPSLARAARRAALFAAFWFAALALTPLGESQTTLQSAFTAVSFFAILWPVGYLTEKFVWSRLQRRIESGRQDPNDR